MLEMKEKINSFTALEVWEKARILAKNVYVLCAAFPKTEQFALTSQIKRSVISIPSNIAEGCGRNHLKDSLQFFFIARGSIYELEAQNYIAYDLEYITLNAFNEILTMIETVRKLLNGFIRYYKNKLNSNNLTPISS